MKITNPVVDELIRTVEGYKAIRVLLDIVEKNGTTQDLEKYFPSYLVMQLAAAPNWIKYQELDYDIWKNLNLVGDGKPLLKEAHDINMEAYIKGIFERNYLIWFDTDMLHTFKFLKDKKIVDLGCGGGFYSYWFSRLTDHVLAIDRPEMIKDIKKYSKEVYNKLTGQEIKKLPFKLATFKNSKEAFKEADVVWLSEVVHGKDVKTNKNFLTNIVNNMKEGAYLIVNELRPGNVLSQFFDLQMKLHCKGKLYTMGEIVSMFPSNLILEWADTNLPYHHMLAAKKVSTSGPIKEEEKKDETLPTKRIRKNPKRSKRSGKKKKQ